RNFRHKRADCLKTGMAVRRCTACGHGGGESIKRQIPSTRSQRSEVKGQKSENGKKAIREFHERGQRAEGRRKIPSPKFQIPNAEYQAYPTKAVRAEKSLRLSGGHERV